MKDAVVPDLGARRKPLSVSVPFISVGCLRRNFSFPYSDDYFSGSPDIFSIDTARASLGFAVSADRDPELPLPEQNSGVLGFLSETGFGNIEFHRYDTVPSPMTAALALGSKEINGSVLIAATVCGNGYGDEWLGNLSVGGGDTHEGFRAASEVCLSEIRSYVSRFLEAFGTRDLLCTQSGVKQSDVKQSDATEKPHRLKIWLSGYSRAAAILGLCAKQIREWFPEAEIYAYLFATPEYILNPEVLPGVFNIVNETDPFVRLQAGWKDYGRHGSDVVLSDRDVLRNPSISKSVADRLGSSVYRSSRYVDGLFDKGLSFFEALFHTNSEYSLVLEEPLKDLYKSHSKTDVLRAVRRVRRNVGMYLPRERMRVFRRIVRFLLSEYFRFRRKYATLCESHDWDSGSRADTNLLREHSGDMYVVRLFS